MLRAYKGKPIDFNIKESLQWLEDHVDSQNKYKQFVKHLLIDMMLKGNNTVKAFSKNEVLVKDTPIYYWNENVSRTIMGHPYAVSALFSPIGLELKRRFKQCL